MRIEPSLIDPLGAGRESGSVWYQRNGVLVRRVIVKPRKPRTAAQSSERSYMIAGMRAWNGSLTEEDRETWA